MTEQERLRRIGDLLCKAILLAEMNGVLPPPLASGKKASADTHSISPAIEGATPREQKILDYLALVGEAPPMTLHSVIGLPRSSAQRVIHRLLVSGRIVSGGQTRALVYRLNHHADHPQKPGLN